VLTLIAAMHVLYEKRAVTAGKRLKESFISEAMVILAATVSLAGTIGAIYFGSVVSKLKDDDLALYKKGADLNIAQLTKDAGIANQTAETAKLETQRVSQENIQLRLGLSKEQIQARRTEAELAKQNKETFDYAHALAQQQAVMTEQARVSPILTDFQIDRLADALRPYAGTDIILHSTLDTTVLRLQNGIATAFQKAGVTFKQNSMDAGALYQGVSVVVHSPTDVPPIANVIVSGLRAAGIKVNTVAMEGIPPGRVGVYTGPN
jgi:hypothetical protein